MSNARQIKQRISSAQNISKITKAMEMVSASKMKRAQDQALSARPYAQALAESLQKLAESFDAHSQAVHALLTTHGQGVPVLLLISTDKGLCGSLNQNLFKHTLAWKKNHPTGKLIIVGKKGVAFSKFSGIENYAQFTDLPDTITTSNIVAITQLIIEKFISQEFAKVDIVFTNFINTLSQQVAVTQLLPLQHITSLADTALVQPQDKAEYVFEPSANAILNDLLPYYIENVVYQSFLESRASEHSARMVAMKNASENARDLVKELKLVFNKTRQASITSELLDITTATMTV